MNLDAGMHTQAHNLKQFSASHSVGIHGSHPLSQEICGPDIRQMDKTSQTYPSIVTVFPFLSFPSSSYNNYSTS